jgi:RNA polymerase sigma-70 factor (ECF subfamily)
MPEGALDEDAIRRFLDTDYARLVAGLSLVTGSQHVAEDAVQEALARAWERSLRGESISSLRSWVAVVALNVVRSRFRRLRVERSAKMRLPEGSRQAVSLDASEDRLDLERALRSIPRRQRDAIVLRYAVDLPIRDVASALKLTEDGAKALLYRARRSLADAIGTGQAD